MTHINVLELALRDPSRVTADLAGHPRHPKSGPRMARADRRMRLHPRRRRTTDPIDI